MKDGSSPLPTCRFQNESQYFDTFSDLQCILCLVYHMCRRPIVLILLAFLCCRMFGMVLEKIIIPEVQKVSGAVEKKICAVGITKILTECPSMMDTEYTKLW